MYKTAINEQYLFKTIEQVSVYLPNLPTLFINEKLKLSKSTLLMVLLYKIQKLLKN